MRSYRILAVLAATVVGSAALCACSSGSEGGPSTSARSPAPGATTATSSLESHTAAPGAVGQSPGGVTTAVGAPAESTEDEYYQACQAAKTWMTAQGGDPKTQFEPYLESVQSSDAPGPGTFEIPWSQLAPGRQAAVIVAAEAAANGLCG
jgi:Putative lipoprotein LpqV